ncbi:MAG: ATP-binding protein [Byssovorax sp.]
MLLDRFNEFAAMLPEAMLLVTTDGVIVAVNPAARRVLVRAGGSVEGSRLTDLAVGAPETILDYLRMCARTRQMLPGSLTLRRADGEAGARYRVHGALLVMRSEAGDRGVLLRIEEASAPSRFVLLTEKIDALSAEIARRRVAEEAVREREERLRVVLTSIGDAVMVTDPQGKITFMNRVAETVTGWPQDEAWGRPLDEVFVIINESTSAPVDSPVAKVLRDGNVVGLANHTLLIARDGHAIPIDDSAAPVRSAAGALEGVVLVFREITERKQAERERERSLVREQTQRLAAEAARAEAEGANRAKDEFLAMLGHELRNPLAPILTALDLLRLRPDMNNEPARLILERQVAHMVRLVDDLLDVSRIAKGKVELAMQRLELAAVVAKAIEIASPLLEKSEQHLAVSVPAQGLAVDGDPTRLAQVVSNVLTNASKYTERGRRITITGATEGAEVVLKVTDTGIGISAEMLPRVFEMFAQERQAFDRSQGGLGLGLAIVHNLVKAHGGSVHAYSAGVGQGSEFTLRFPAARAEVAPAAGAAVPTRTPSDAGDDTLKILVVDDNADAGAMLALLLRKLGHAVRVVHDGPSALESLDSFTPDVAFLDLGLPIMDGHELARLLREKPALTGLRLVAVTGYGQESDRLRSADAGFDLHLVKPVGRERLKEVIQTFARERR